MAALQELKIEPKYIGWGLGLYLILLMGSIWSYGFTKDEVFRVTQELVAKEQQFTSDQYIVQSESYDLVQDLACTYGSDELKQIILTKTAEHRLHIVAMEELMDASSRPVKTKSTKDSKDSEDSEDNKTTIDGKDSKDRKNTKDTKNTKDSNEANDSKDTKEQKLNRVANSKNHNDSEPLTTLRVELQGDLKECLLMLNELTNQYPSLQYRAESLTLNNGQLHMVYKISNSQG